jgi:hypothetical protein
VKDSATLEAAGHTHDPAITAHPRAGRDPIASARVGLTPDFLHRATLVKRGDTAHIFTNPDTPGCGNCITGRIG